MKISVEQSTTLETVAETWAEKVARLQHEIAVRQVELEYLVLGDRMGQVSAPIDATMPIIDEKAEEHRRQLHKIAMQQMKVTGPHPTPKKE